MQEQKAQVQDEQTTAASADERLYAVRHSLAHVMAQAVLTLRPNAKLAFGPPIENGFYYDFDFDVPLSSDDFPRIEEEMKKIIKERQPFSRSVRAASDAISYLEECGEVYKAEYAKELAEKGETEIGFYSNGPFEDMCRGPHVAHTGELPRDGFHVDSVAGAYWRGDEHRPQLTRIYAVAFTTKQELKEFLKRRELARERDHRKLGRQLELFTFSDEVGQGLPLWMPNGTTLREALEDFAKETEFRAGYQRVVTPHITKEGLYHTSGHLPYYAESMYPPMVVDDEAYYLKPMNCPHHHMIYRSRPRSYRELPLRLAEYGTCYRYEDSGSLAGLLRVRMLSMNDAHIYCRPDQLRKEFAAVLEMHKLYYNKFRLSDYWTRLSTYDPKNVEKYVENHEMWTETQEIIRQVLIDDGVRFEIGEGEAAFYGPKVDFQIRNVIGREETASTNQLDFAMPERFSLSYVGEDGREHRPYIIHRAPLGTHERFIAFLIEHFGGAFPTWMAPVQAIMIPVSDKFTDYADRCAAFLRNDLIRVEVDASADSFNKRVRKAITQKIPNILICGGREEASSEVTWRRYCIKEQRTLPFAAFHVLLKQMILRRTMDNFSDEALPE